MSEPSSNVRPVYAVVGHDRFLRTEALDRIVRTLAPETDSLGPTHIGGENASLADILDEVRTPSLLGGRRVVIVDDADDWITANRAALERYCSAPALAGCLILLCDSMPKTTRLRKIISSGGEVIEFEPPKGRALVGWIVRRARDAYGKQLSDLAAQKLKEHLGDALGWLDAELAKLAAYVGDRPEITPNDIDAATGEHREEKVFAVINAVAAGDTNGALRAWEKVWATDRAAPGRAIGGLSWAVRDLLRMRRGLDGGAHLREVAPKFADLSVLQRRLERTNVEQLREQQRDLLAADVACKTGLSTVDVAVERFIVKHSALAPAERRNAG